MQSCEDDEEDPNELFLEYESEISQIGRRTMQDLEASCALTGGFLEKKISNVFFTFV